MHSAGAFQSWVEEEVPPNVRKTWYRQVTLLQNKRMVDLSRSTSIRLISIPDISNMKKKNFGQPTRPGTHNFRKPLDVLIPLPDVIDGLRRNTGSNQGKLEARQTEVVENRLIITDATCMHPRVTCERIRWPSEHCIVCHNSRSASAKT